MAELKAQIILGIIAAGIFVWAIQYVYAYQGL